MKQKFTPEFWVLFIGLILTGIGMLGATVAWSIEHFATKDDVSIEREERRELKAEIDTLYSLQVPEDQRRPLAHPHRVGERE